MTTVNVMLALRGGVDDDAWDEMGQGAICHGPMSGESVRRSTSGATAPTPSTCTASNVDAGWEEHVPLVPRGDGRGAGRRARAQPSGIRFARHGAPLAEIGEVLPRTWHHKQIRRGLIAVACCYSHIVHELLEIDDNAQIDINHKDRYGNTHHVGEHSRPRGLARSSC